MAQLSKSQGAQGPVGHGLIATEVALGGDHLQPRESSTFESRVWRIFLVFIITVKIGDEKPSLVENAPLSKISFSVVQKFYTNGVVGAFRLV